MIQQPGSTDAQAVADYSRAVMSSLLAIAEPPTVPASPPQEVLGTTTPEPSAGPTPLATPVALPAFQNTPQQRQEDVTTATQAITNDFALFIPPRPSPALADIDRQFRAQRAVRSQV